MNGLRHLRQLLLIDKYTFIWRDYQVKLNWKTKPRPYSKAISGN